MSYKVKSLVYFVCFLTATFTYYITGSEGTFENNASKEVAELNMENIKLDKSFDIK